MKICGHCGKSKHLNLFYANRNKEDGKQGNCIECMTKWRQNNKDKVKKANSKFYGLNSEEIIQQNSLYTKNNQEKTNKYQKEYRESHKEEKLAYNKKWFVENSEYVKEYRAKYIKENSDIISSKQSKTRAAKLQRIPKWLTASDWIEIQWAYTIAKQMTQETGIKHEVDHIIPLTGKNVSGLHCPQNLQILTKSQNLSKFNKFPYARP